MDAKQRFEVTDYILETLLFEVEKDGTIEPEEEVIIQKIVSKLQISKDQFQTTRKRVRQALKENKASGAFDPNAFYCKVRARLMNLIGVGEVRFILERIEEVLETRISKGQFVLGLSDNFMDNLKSSDVGIRSIAQQDLINSTVKNKLDLLRKLIPTEKDVQLQYELRKAIRSFERVQIDHENEQVQQLRHALASTNKAVVKDAFAKLVNGKFTELIKDAVAAEKKYNEAFMKLCNIRLMAMVGNRYFNDILGYLDDADTNVKCAIADALIGFRSTAAYAQLMILCNDESTLVANHCRAYLAKMDESKQLALCDRMVDSKFPAYRFAAAKTLARLATPGALKVLKKLEPDSSTTIQRLLKKVFSKYQMPEEENTAAADVKSTTEKKELTAKLLSTKSSTAVNSSKKPETQDLVELRNAAFTPVFESLKKERDSRKFLQTMQALIQLDGTGEDSLELLKYFAKNAPDERIRAYAVESLSEKVINKAPELLLDCLQDRSCVVVSNTLVALSKVPKYEDKFSEVMVPAIKKLVASPIEKNQMSSIHSLAAIGNKNWMMFLKPLLNTRYMKVLAEASETLAAHGYSEQLKVLSKEFDAKLQEKLEKRTRADLESTKPWYLTKISMAISLLLVIFVGGFMLAWVGIQKGWYAPPSFIFSDKEIGGQLLVKVPPGWEIFESNDSGELLATIENQNMKARLSILRAVEKRRITVATYLRMTKRELLKENKDTEILREEENIDTPTIRTAENGLRVYKVPKRYEDTFHIYFLVLDHKTIYAFNFSCLAEYASVAEPQMLELMQSIRLNH
jgi:HEAT repeat protein